MSLESPAPSAWVVPSSSHRGGLDASNETSSPIFIPTNSEFGGVNNEFPYQRDSWSKNLGEPIVVGAKFGLLSQSRGNGMALAPRVMLKFPSGGATSASTKDYSGTFDLVASGEAGGRFELSGLVGYVFRGDSDDFSVTDGFRWGLGAGFPSRAPLRVLLEFEGEVPVDDAALVSNPPLIGSGRKHRADLQRYVQQHLVQSRPGVAVQGRILPAWRRQLQLRHREADDWWR